MSEWWSKFFAAFFGSLLLFAAAIAVIFGLAFIVYKFGPMLTIPLVLILAAAFAGVMHATQPSE